jgi:hypothetical protein
MSNGTNIGRGMSNGMATHVERNNDAWQTEQNITNGDTRRTEQRCMANGTKHNQWRRHCKAVRVCELSNDGMQKRKENFFFFYFILLLLLFSSYFSSKTTTKVTHYMIASSKTHRNA